MLTFMVLLFCLVNLAYCGQLYGLEGVPRLHFDQHLEYASNYDEYKPRDYHFNYGVSDPHTGDHKSQWETKENGVVRGGYSLLEPDGTTRIVEYIADEHGFRAVVKKIGASIHPQVETHGHVPEVPHTPIEQPVVPITYHSYDGQAENYQHDKVPIFDKSQLVPLISSTLVDQGYHHVIDDKYVGQPGPLNYDVPQEKIQQVLPVYQYQYQPEEPLQFEHKYPEEVAVLPPKSALGVPLKIDEKVEYHGLTGNPDDDSEYTKDYTYEGEYTQKISTVLPSPTNQHFTIFFPGFVKNSWR